MRIPVAVDQTVCLQPIACWSWSEASLWQLAANQKLPYHNSCSQSEIALWQQLQPIRKLHRGNSYSHSEAVLWQELQPSDTVTVTYSLFSDTVENSSDLTVKLSAMLAELLQEHSCKWNTWGPQQNKAKGVSAWTLGRYTQIFFACRVVRALAQWTQRHAFSLYSFVIAPCQLCLCEDSTSQSLLLWVKQFCLQLVACWSWSEASLWKVAANQKMPCRNSCSQSEIALWQHLQPTVPFFSC